MKKLLIFFILISLIVPVSALTMHVEGNCVNERVKVTLDKPAFVTFRINNGTPIYAYGSEVTFVPHVTGVLYIDAICGNERVTKGIPILKQVKFKGYTLPTGSFTKIIEGKEYEVKWRTALGVLERASQIRNFDYVLEKKSWGLYVKCIKGVCEKSEGATSGWMYWVNYPNDPLPGVSADQYEIKGGDTVVWYFSRSMEETPDTSPYKIEISVSPSYDLNIKIVWGKRTSTKVEAKVSKVEETAISKANETSILNKTSISNVMENFDIVSLILESNKSVEVIISKAKAEFVIARSVYKSFRLEGNESVEGYIEFRIPKEWLKNRGNVSDVVLMENGKDLKTEFVREDTNYYYFKSKFNYPGVFAVTVKWKNFPLKVTDKPIIKALSWLKEIQNDDGGFSNPGENSSVSATSWAVMALVAAKQDPHEWKKNSYSPIDYLREHLNESIEKMGTADYARTILALKAAGENPRNFSGIDFVKKLKSRVKDNGQIGDFVYTTIWGILALKTCGENVTKSVEWLIKQQNEDGGFAWTVGEKSDYDDTAAAIEALIAAGVDRDSKVIKKALEYLKTGQNEDGGFRYFGYSASNAASDAWIIQALVAAGENPTKWRKNNVSVVDHLLSLQTEEGYFKYTNIQTSNPGYMTVCAVMALLGKPHPIKAEEFVNLTLIEQKEIKQKKINETTSENEYVSGSAKETNATIQEKIPEKQTPGFEVVSVIVAILIVVLRKI